MRKFKLGFIFFIGLVSLFFVRTPVSIGEDMPTMMDLIQQSNYDVIESDKPKSAVLIDGNTGKYLWGENPDEAHNPASIMKLMVLYFVYEAIHDGRITMDTEIMATPRYEQMAGIYEISNNNIVSGVSYPVKELIPMALVPSSNVATMMLADLIEPNAVTLLQKMNDKAKELGMTQTKIVNATGAEISAFQGLYAMEDVDTSLLDTQGSNTSTARDFASFTYYLLKNFPEILDYTKTPLVTVMEGTQWEETFETYNYSLPGLEYAYEGVDGLKTGSSPSGAFNIDTTAKQGELRLIAIVFGVGDWSDQTGEYKRHPFSNAMLDYGFDQFEYKELLGAGEQTVDEKRITVTEPLKDTVKKGTNITFHLNEDGQLTSSNPLTPVSDTIKPVSVAYTSDEPTLLPDVTDESKGVGKLKSMMVTVFKTQPLIKWGVIIFVSLVIVLLILIIILMVSQSRQRKKRKKERRSGR